MISPSTRVWMVPMSPVGIPAFRAIDSIRKETEVFPFVPVTPTTSSSRLGWRWTAAASGASAPRVSATTSCGTPASTG